MAHVPPEQDESQSPSTLHQQQQQLTPTHTTTETTHVAERRGLTNSNDLHITIPQPPITTTTATPTAPLITNSPTSFTHSDVANDPEKQQPQDRPSPARSLSRPLFEPLRNRPQARQTFAEGMNHGIQSLRRTVFNRTHSTKNDRYRLIKQQPFNCLQLLFLPSTFILRSINTQISFKFAR